LEWIKKQYKDVFWFYVIVGGAVTGIISVTTGAPFFPGYFYTLLGAYGFLTLQIAVRIVWSTIFKKKEQDIY
jgi:hypothetical protein